MYNKIDTPCIGICSTVYGDAICKGCKRESKEVINWNQYQRAEKQKVYKRLDKQIEKFTKEFIEITNEEKIKIKIEEHKIKHPASDYLSSFNLIYYLLRTMGNKVTFPEEYGFNILPKAKKYSLIQIYTIIDNEILKYAKENYQKENVDNVKI